VDPSLEKTVLADGTIFFHISIDEKMYMKNPVPCQKDAFASIRRWYNTFQETSMQYGIFVFPLWLFRKHHGGEWGFSVGDTADDDVPTNLRMTCLQSSTIIYQVLSQSTMFPAGSYLHDVVASCYGNGLKALKMILQRAHPAFVDEPATLVTKYPTQRNNSLLEYKMEFEDFLQMRAMVLGHSRELDDKDELDIFINNLKDSAFVQRITRDERRQASLEYKYKSDHLLETLNSILMMPDNPSNIEKAKQARAIRALTTPPPDANTGRRSSRIPNLRARRNPRVNAVGAASPNSTATSSSGGRGSSGGSGDQTDPEEYYDYDQDGSRPPPLSEENPGPFTNFEDACVNLVTIEIPDTEDASRNLAVFDSYRKAVLAIKNDANVAFGQHCIVCKAQHRFENCPTLNDHEFLKKHYIRFCQNVRRDHTDLQDNRAPVNFMDRSYMDDSDSASEGDVRDFHHGRS